MSDSDYILMMISALVGLTSLAISTRRSGFIYAYVLSSTDKYALDWSRGGEFCRGVALAVVVTVVVGLFFSQDLLTALYFMTINTVFIGYAIAWRIILKPIDADRETTKK